MTKSRLLVLVIAVSIVLAASAAFARSWFDVKPTSEHAARIQQYQLQNVKAVTDADDASASSTGQASVMPRQSLGSALSPTAGSPGVSVDNSYDDWQWTYAAHHVEWKGKPYIHFAYVDRQAGSTGVNKHGYNGYNPIVGQWPRGQNAGCQLQVGEDVGMYPNLDVTSKGRVVMAGHQTTWQSGATLDNIIWFQAATAFSCTFSGSLIDSSQYKAGMLSYKKDSARLYQLMVEEQEWNGDTITHLVGQQGAQAGVTIAGTKNCTIFPMQYFRKMTFGATGTWVGPITLDTAQRMSHLCASRVSPKVALIYLKYTPEGISHDNFDDQTVYYRESDSIGATWKPAVNITPYNRSTGPSWAPWVEAHGLYDSNDKLHIIWNASPVAKNPYDAASNYTWGILTTGSSIFHWSNATGVISRIHNAEWDNLQTLYSSGTLCGFMGTNYLTTGAMGLSECHGHLYVTWVMGNDPNAVPPLLNDCGSGGVLDNRFKANGEIYMSVSSDLSGLLWDKYRDLTNTHTPGCDSAGFGGICYSDTKATMSRYGMDITSFDTNGFPITPIWPDTGVNPGPGAYTGNYYTHLIYTEDHWPGNKGAENSGNSPQGQWTLNPLKWMRLACVDPISAPQIDWTPKHMGYAEKEWVKHHKADTTVVTVTNDGNATLHVTAIGVKRTSQTGIDWLGTSASTLTVNAGVGNTATFSIYTNKNGIINSPGTIVSLNGEVGLKTDVAAPRDTCTITIENFLVADTLVGLKWDTVTTGCTRLVVSNNGDVGKLGNGGNGGLNLDYINSGTECDSNADTYLYDGGPIVIRKSGSTYIYSAALHQGDFVTEQSFKPFAQGPSPSSIVGVGYDGFYTGTFVNKDTTIGVRRTYYAPTFGSDTCNFVIQKTVFFGIGGAKTNVTLGEVIDFDVPTMTGSNNDGKVLTSKSAVYQVGLDTVTANNTRCVKFSNRYASCAFLGMYTAAEYLADTCKNDVSFYGAYVMNNDTLFKYDTLSNTREGEYYWTRMNALSGLTAAPTQSKDLHTVVTYKSNLATLDTLTAFTAVISVKNGDTTALKTGIDKAKAWYSGHVRHCKAGSCCTQNSSDGRTGNVDADPGKGVDISDLSALIDYLYISFTVPQCLLSANIDGDPSDGVDISDLSALIDYLYISFTPPALCH